MKILGIYMKADDNSIDIVTDQQLYHIDKKNDSNTIGKIYNRQNEDVTTNTLYVNIITGICQFYNKCMKAASMTNL